MAVVHPAWRLDPVAELSGDMAALCLSFLDVRTLLGVAQHVSHAWRDAIDGGLPAVWHEVCVELLRTASARLVEVVQRSHGDIRKIKLTRMIDARTAMDLSSLRSLSNLRVLKVDIGPLALSLSTVLLSFPLLEEILVADCPDLVFSALQFLRTVECRGCRAVRGLHNLPSLTKLYSDRCGVDTSLPWPTSLRGVIIHANPYNPQVIDRLAALQQLAALETNWSFVHPIFNDSAIRPPPCAVLDGFTALQRLSIDFPPFGDCPNINDLGTLTSLRELSLVGGKFTDEDLQCLVQLTHLEDLCLQHNDIITSVTLRRVADLPNLTKLDISCCDDVTKWSHLGRCAKLRELVLVGDKHLLTLAEAEAICQLQHLELLWLAAKRFVSPLCLPRICTMRYLRELWLFVWSVPWAEFSALPSLSSLHTLHFSPPDEDLSRLVDCLVQMPKLKRITLGSSFFALNAEQQTRLRIALPRLETLRR